MDRYYSDYFNDIGIGRHEVMKYGIKINLYTDNQGLLKAVNNLINFTSGNVVHTRQAELENDNMTTIFDGRVAEIHFDNDNDRAVMVNDLRGLSGMIHACEKPSKIIGFNFNHAENQSCELTDIYEAV